MAVNGMSDIEGLPWSLLRKIQIAVAQSGRPLAADWSDIWMHTLAVDALHDVRASAVQSRRKNYASNGSSDWFLLTPTTGISAHQGRCSLQFITGVSGAVH